MSDQTLHEAVKSLLERHSPEQIITAVRQQRDEAKQKLKDQLDEQQAAIDEARRKAGLPVRGERKTKAKAATK